VKIVGPCRLVDILAEWGSHDTERRRGRPVTDTVDAVDFTLNYYAWLTGQILAAVPRHCIWVELDASDIPLLVAVTGRLPLTEWAALRAESPGHEGPYIKGMVASPEPIAGPLVVVCSGELTIGGVTCQAPLVVFEGCHRGGAWVLKGAPHRIRAGLILTERPP
jgi:hypothetical protein